MNHVDHLATVIECISQDKPVPMCPDCAAIVATWTVAGTKIKMETFDD